MSMKKILVYFLCICIALVVCACGSGSSSENGAENETEAVSLTEEQDREAKTGDTDIDVDLTALSSTMVYSEVFNMMSEPDSYLGKTVKMQGSFAVYHDEATDKYYYACIIQDATACCSQGLEFELDGNYKYPEDYPQVGKEISVIGVFDVYQEGEDSFCVLRKATMEEI